jgi:hypothetical protein
LGGGKRQNERPTAVAAVAWSVVVHRRTTHGSTALCCPCHSIHTPTHPHTHKTAQQGILFVTYSTSIGHSRMGDMEEGEGTTRVDQLVEWAGGGLFNGA